MIEDPPDVGAVPDDDQDGIDDLYNFDGDSLRLQTDENSYRDRGDHAGQGGHPSGNEHDHEDDEGQEKVQRTAAGKRKEVGSFFFWNIG